MTYPEARIWIVKSSLGMIGAFGAFLLLSPTTRYPLFFEQSIAILQIIIPLFLGYLSSAIVFVTTSSPNAEDPNAPRSEISEMFRLLVKGPFIVVLLLLVIAFMAFGVSNWPSEDTNTSGFTFDMLSSITSFLLGIHTATTSALVAWLFKEEKADAK